ncbi:hypothetical protein MHYP_G00202620 [Metynnis hypsauchen]
MSGEEPPGQKPKCFPDILDLVFHLSDGQWRTMMTDVSIEVSQLQFASLCANSVISVAMSAGQSCMPTVTRAFGMDTALVAEESESMSLSDKSSPTNYTVPSSGSSAERSSVDPADHICNTVENFASEVNVEMENSSTKSPEDSSHTSETLVAQPVHIVKSRETTANHVSRRVDLTNSSTNDVSGGIKCIYHPTTSRAVCSLPTLHTGSTMLIRSPRRTMTPRFQLNLGSCMDGITLKVVELNKRELLLSSSSKMSLHVSTLPRELTVKVTTVKPKGFFTEAAQAVSGATVHEDGTIFEEVDSAPQIGAVTQPQSPQRLHLTSDEMRRCLGHDHSTFTFVRTLTGPSRVWKSSLDSLLKTSRDRNNQRRDLIQVPSVQANVSMDDFMKMMFQHVLSLKPGSSDRTGLSASLTVLDQDMAGTSFEAQDSSSNKCLSLPFRTSGEPEDPLALLRNAEQAESDSTDDISAHDVTSTGASPTASSKAGSQIVTDTLETCSTSSQQMCSSTSSPLGDREAVAVRKSQRFNFFVGKKSRFISLGQKRSTEACPAGVESRNHQSASDSGAHQESLRRESTVTPFKQMRIRLSRIFSAICKALPNPCSCMTRPS